jgi:hypothetical protein
MPSDKPKPEFVVLAPYIAYPPHRRAKHGEVVNDLPADAVKPLLASGDIVRAADAPKKLPPPRQPEVAYDIVRHTDLTEEI